MIRESGGIGPLRFIYSNDSLGGLAGDMRLHISVSLPNRLPTWEELKLVKSRIAPDLPMCVLLPPQKWWMSVHPYCIHLWELKDKSLIDEMRGNADVGVVDGSPQPK